jgi:hypothetical protein
MNGSGPDADIFGGGNDNLFAPPAGFNTFKAPFSAPAPQAMLRPGMNMPPMMPPQPVKSTGFPKNRIIVIVMIIVVVLAGLYVLVYLRRKSAKVQGPFAERIMGIADPEQQADMREWNYLWTVARRPAVKNVLHDVLTAELSGSGASSASLHSATSYSHPSPPPPSPVPNFLASAHLADNNDPNFSMA